jgi:hypothetical protein
LANENRFALWWHFLGYCHCFTWKLESFFSSRSSHVHPRRAANKDIIMDDIIKLNVGGQLFTTTRATLCAEAGSMLAAKFDPESKFAPPKEIDGTFEYVLEYLRHGCQVVLDIPDDLFKAFHVKADYYFGLKALVRASTHVPSLSDEQLEDPPGQDYP